MRVYLVRPNQSEPAAIPVLMPIFLLGRGSRCHLRPYSELVSKVHCAILQRDGALFVRDLHSTNGTFVNDAPVRAESPLQNGDSLRVAALSFQVRIDEHEAPPAAIILPDSEIRSINELIAAIEQDDTAVQEVAAGTKTMPAISD